jgi:hypothetical protein
MFKSSVLVGQRFRGRNGKGRLLLVVGTLFPTTSDSTLAEDKQLFSSIVLVRLSLHIPLGNNLVALPRWFVQGENYAAGFQFFN